MADTAGTVDTTYGRTTWTNRAISLVGLALVGALSLAACGSDDGDDAAATSGASGTTSTSSTATESTSAAPTDSASADPASASGEGNGAGASGGGGSASSSDDAAQITTLTTGLNGKTTMADYMQYNLDHACSSYIESNGGRANFQNQIDAMRKENQTLSEVGGEYNVADVTDIKVNGNDATATVSGTLGGQSRSETVNYLRENGAWTICPAS